MMIDTQPDEIDPGLLDRFSQRGFKSRLARHLGVSPQALNNWRRVPRERVLEVEEFTGISRYKLRPDLKDWFDKAMTAPKESCKEVAA